MAIVYAAVQGSIGKDVWVATNQFGDQIRYYARKLKTLLLCTQLAVENYLK